MNESPITFLYRLERFGVKLGLRNISLLVDQLGHPQRSYPTIHIAGTNGKGSTSSMIASILTSAGYRTGLYTSPHLLDFRERIRIDGQEIPEHLLALYVEALRPLIRRTAATFFEATTAIAFQYFADEQVDVAVVETGLGGRFDATNVVVPCLSVITSIGIDHVAQLGRTTDSIAFEKAGIIKNGVPVVAGEMDVAAASVIARVAHGRHAPLINVADVSSASIVHRSLAGTRIDFSTRGFRMSDVMVALAGDFQLDNVRVVLSTVPLLRRAGFRIPEFSLREGLSQIRQNTGLRGRLEVLSYDPPVIADVAHNPDAMNRLTGSLRKLIPGRFVTIVGLMRDKDYDGVVASLSMCSRIAIAVRPETPRSLDPAHLMERFHHRRNRAIIGGTVAAGIEKAFSLRRKNEAILITGSHYVVGEALQILH